FTPTGGFKPYSQVELDVSSLAFETLAPVGIVPDVNYLVKDAQVDFCTAGIPPLRDLSQYLAYDPFYYIKNPGAPVAKIRVTNTSSVTVEGPIHMLLEEMTPGRTVVNPDGDYLGS